MQRAKGNESVGGWRGWAVLAVLAVLAVSRGLLGGAGELAGQAGLPQPLPPPVVAAWEQAGPRSAGCGRR
jgi:hypothetical protein